MPTNPRMVELLAINEVIRYELENGRIAHRVKQGHGYDVFSKGEGDERHIEVKGRSKRDFGKFIRLYHSEFERLQQDPHFWVYYVHSIDSGNPVVVPLSPDILKRTRKKRYYTYEITLTKSEWDDIERTTE